MSSQLFQISWHLGKSLGKPADHVLIFVIQIDDAFKLLSTGVQPNRVYSSLNIKRFQYIPEKKNWRLALIPA